MALETSLQELCTKLATLREVLSGLRITVREDQPLAGGSLLADSLGDITEELLAGAREALVHARAALRAAGPPLDGERARAGLAACQACYLPLQARFFSELLRYERLAELTRAGRERGREWRAWAGTVRQGAEACRLPLQDACESLFAAWREVAERGLPLSSVSVRAVGIDCRAAAGPVADDELESGWPKPMERFLNG